MTRAVRTVVTERTRHLESASLLILLAVAGLRPLISESHDLARPEMSSALSGMSDPLPIATLLIDAAILFAAVLWGLAHALSAKRPYRWTGLEPGLVLILAGMAISCATASNKRVAINASVDWLSMAVLALVLAQLLRDTQRFRLAICVIVATGAAQAYQCFDQVFVSFAETEQMYLQHREAMWSAQGIPLDSSQVDLFERRLRAREASGYLSHSNIAAAHLLLAFFVALAAAAARLAGAGTTAERAPGILALLVAGLIAAAMLLTHSFGAMVAAAAGLGLGLVWNVGRGWIERRRTRVLLGGWGLVFCIAITVTGYGLWRGSLPGQSLNFRWGYWTASAELFRDHFWTGVGRENFGNAYLKYKSIAWPEEVKNPHNFLVTAAAEWGLLGLVGVLAMLIGGSIALVLRRPRSGCEVGNAAESDRTRRSVALWMLSLAVLIFGPRTLMLGSNDRNYVYVATVLPGFFWLIAFAITVFDPAPVSAPRKNCTQSMLPWLGAGLLAFLLQETISFATIVPGAAVTFFAVVGTLLGSGRMAAAETVLTPLAFPRLHRCAPAFLSAGFFALVASCLLPTVWRTSYWVSKARASADVPIDGSLENHPAETAFRQATSADPIDPAPAAEHADWLRRRSADSPDPGLALGLAVQALDQAIVRDPRSVGNHSRRAMIALALARGGDSSYASTALNSARRAVELYPTRPSAHLDLAACLRFLGEREGHADLMREASAAYLYALALDNQRPAWETIRRLRPQQVSETRANIAAVEAWLAAHPKT